MESSFRQLPDTFEQTGLRLGQNIDQSVRDFGDSNYVEGSKDFLNSNSYVAKFAFLLLVIIGFVILLRVGTALLAWAFSPSNSPILVSGMKDGKKAVTVTMDPKLSGSKPVMRSDNQEDGIEFTYSTWIMIEDLVYKQGTYRHIFHKGNDNANANGMNSPNNAPGLYIAPNKNNLVVRMNTFNDIDEEVIIPDVPLNKWINIVIRVEGRTLDVYINGTISVRHTLNGVPKQNYGNVYVNTNGGFDGFLSKLQYWNYALSTNKILDVANDGPDLTMNKSMDVFPPYFSLRWFLQQ